MTTRDEQLSAVIEWMSRAVPLDEVLLRLRNRGCSMGDCTLILADACDVDLDEAKRLVVTSTAWNDHRAAYEAIEEAFWSAAQKLGEEDEGGTVRINFSDL